MSQERVCTECAFCEHHGEGYSSYTITGETMICVKEVRPNIDTDDYKQDVESLSRKWAKDCAYFIAGTGVRTGLYIDEAHADRSRGEVEEWLDWLKLHPHLKDDEHVGRKIASFMIERIK